MQQRRDATAAQSQNPIANHLLHRPRLLPTLSMPILKGRSENRDRNGAMTPAVISARAADMLWPGRDPISHQFSRAIPTSTSWLLAPSPTGARPDRRGVAADGLRAQLVQQRREISARRAHERESGAMRFRATSRRMLSKADNRARRRPEPFWRSNKRQRRRQNHRQVALETSWTEAERSRRRNRAYDSASNVCRCPGALRHRASGLTRQCSPR
jgi:hypothetical protein